MSVVALDSRRAFSIGGSEAAAACGLDPWRSRVMLWAEKTGRIERDDSEPASWGRLLQPVICGELERRGWEVSPAPPDGFRDEERPWMTGHPDGFTEVERVPGVLEVKTAGAWAGREWHEEAGAPLAYLVQLQHYFALTGYDVGLLACLVGGQRLETRVVHRDDTAIGRMIELEAAFLEYVKSDSPPPPDGSASAADALAALYPESRPGSVVRLDKRGWAEYRALKARREQRAAIDRQVAELEQRLKARIGEAEAAISPHDEICARWTSYERTALDTKLLRKSLPHIADQYSETKTLRRFTLE
jgi:putative phage-type endonuclease